MRLRSLASRLAGAPAPTRALLAAAAVAVAVLLAASAEPALAAGGRAALVALALAGIAWRLRRPRSAPEGRLLIAVEERRVLSRDSAVALLTVRGRSLLVGYGTDGVRLLAELGQADGGGDR